MPTSRPTSVPEEYLIKEPLMQKLKVDSGRQMDGAVEPRSFIHDDGWRGGFPDHLAECAKSSGSTRDDPQIECLGTHGDPKGMQD
jgi:hypothetical protein